MYWVWLIIVGVVISLLSNFVVLKSKKSFLGYWGLLVVDLIGAWLGDIVFGNWALINDYNIVGGLIGAIVLDVIWKYVVSPWATKSSGTDTSAKA
ncbi:hypothetical protein [Mahella australiensis]|uniref:Transglycosylase-associated protein n=1 Tax=Mahella australiensis (strain DSM 15567 / CIP 107919 / 50-1 BON) TaxID=697281 RepID=F4A136_MAHA5|nr:hypothetical protein [Mahella australiensis]AEE95939.1 hypothetical protein Mahau_0739 [Mahella australiensis 50-1 BON]